MLSVVGTQTRRQEGFTLIELLVVIVIIGVLAAIAISAYIGQRHKAEDAVAKSVVRSAMITIECAYAESCDFTAIEDTHLKLIETAIVFVDAANAAAAPTADAAANEANWCGTSAATYEVGSLSRSGKRFGVAVDKGASGGNTFFVNGEARDW